VRAIGFKVEDGNAKDGTVAVQVGFGPDGVNNESIVARGDVFDRDLVARNGFGEKEETVVDRPNLVSSCVTSVCTPELVRGRGGRVKVEHRDVASSGG